MSSSDTTNLSNDQLRADAIANVQALRKRKTELDSDSIDLILTGARSHYAWQDKPVPEELIQRLYTIMASGPTSMNTCPARLIFVTSDAGKTRLAKSLKEKNIEKMMTAPLTVILAYDLEFWTELRALFPHEDRTGFFKGKEQHCYDTAFRNSTLQGAYFMLGARALGLDVGAMSGFSNEIVDQEFFADTSLRSNFLCNLGYADESALFQKLPRLSFDEACKFV